MNECNFSNGTAAHETRVCCGCRLKRRNGNPKCKCGSELYEVPLAVAHSEWPARAVRATLARRALRREIGEQAFREQWLKMAAVLQITRRRLPRLEVPV